MICAASGDHDSAASVDVAVVHGVDRDRLLDLFIMFDLAESAVLGFTNPTRLRDALHGRLGLSHARCAVRKKRRRPLSAWWLDLAEGRPRSGGGELRERSRHSDTAGGRCTPAEAARCLRSRRRSSARD